MIRSIRIRAHQNFMKKNHNDNTIPPEFIPDAVNVVAIKIPNPANLERIGITAMKVADLMLESLPTNEERMTCCGLLIRSLQAAIQEENDKK